MKKTLLLFCWLVTSTVFCADTTNFPISTRSVTVNTNGNSVFGTNQNQTITLKRGESNMITFELERTTHYKPLFFPDSAKSYVSELGTEKLSNTGFELLTTAGMPTNWFPSVNFGDFAKSAQAKTGTNGLICTNSTIYAVSFDGDDYALGGTNENYTIALVVHRQGSAECWIKLNALPATKAIVFEKVNKYDSTKSISMQITSSGKVQMRFHGGGSGYDQTVDSSFILTAGNWYHVAVTFDLLGLSAVFYLNGVPHASTISHADGIYPSDSHYVIGYSTNDSNYGLNGGLSEIRIWDHVRNDAQILTNRLTRLSGSETGLVHCWTMNEASGVIIDDKVSGAANAEFAAAPNDPGWNGISSAVYSEPLLVTPGTNMQVSLYYYGDGSNIGSYGVYDPINAQWVLPMRNLPGASVEWNQTAITFAVPINTTYLEAVLSGPTAGYTIFDDVSLKNAGTTANTYALMTGTLARYVDEFWWSGERLLQASMTGVLFTNWTGYNSGLINGYMSGGNATNLTLLTATTATIGSATITNLTGFGGSLANMSSAQSTNVITPNLTATGGSATNLSSVNSTNLTSTTANITTVNAGTINSTNVNSTNLTATTANITTVNASTVNSTNINSTKLTALTIMAGDVHTTNLNTTNITTSTITATTVSGSITGIVNSPSGTFDMLYPLLSSNSPGTGYELWSSPMGIALSSNKYYATPIKWSNGGLYVGAQTGIYATNASNMVIGSGAMRSGTNGYQNIVIGNNSGNYLSGSRNIIIGEEAAASQVIYGLINAGATNLAETTSYYDESFSGYINSGSFELWMQTTNAWDGDAVYTIAEIAAGTTNYMGFGIGKVGGVGKMTLSAWNVNASAIVTIAQTVVLPESNAWNHFMWCWQRAGTQSPETVDYLVINWVTNGVLINTTQTAGFGSRASSTTSFAIGPVVRKATQIRVWNYPIWGTTPWEEFGVTNIMRTYLDTNSIISLDPIGADHLLHSYPMIYNTSTDIDDYGYSPSSLQTPNTFARATDLPWPIFDPTSCVYNDVSCGFLGDGARKLASVPLTNAWGFGKNATVSANNTFSFSGYLLPALGYKSSDGSSGGTSNIVIWSNDGKNPATKITISFKNGLYSGHIVE